MVFAALSQSAISFDSKNASQALAQGCVIPPPGLAASASASLISRSHPGAAPFVAARETPAPQMISARPSAIAALSSAGAASGIASTFRGIRG